MLKFYLTTVIVWMIIINSITIIFKDALNKKIGVTKTNKAGFIQRTNTLFALSAIPIIRLGVAIIIIYIATCKQEDFDKLMETVKENEKQKQEEQQHESF